jgi:hypothetical protein
LSIWGLISVDSLCRPVHSVTSQTNWQAKEAQYFPSLLFTYLHFSSSSILFFLYIYFLHNNSLCSFPCILLRPLFHTWYVTSSVHSRYVGHSKYTGLCRSFLLRGSLQIENLEEKLSPFSYILLCCREFQFSSSQLLFEGCLPVFGRESTRVSNKNVDVVHFYWSILFKFLIGSGPLVSAGWYLYCKHSHLPWQPQKMGHSHWPLSWVNNNIFINCKWVDTRWQWLFYMYTKYDIDYY